MDQSTYWNERWIANQTGWDIGYASSPITNFFKSYSNKNAAILIPGCGNAYEADYLIENGYTNITLIDLAPHLVDDLKIKYYDQKNIKVLCQDFFQLIGHYDVVIEQTFFCAIPIDKRSDYVTKMHELLNQDGIIIGVMFDKIFDNPGPPHSGSIDEYLELFSTNFEIKKMEQCYNSIPPRAGSEVFVKFVKK